MDGWFSFGDRKIRSREVSGIPVYLLVFALLLLLCETRSHVAQAVLRLATQLQLVLNYCSCCLHLPSEYYRYSPHTQLQRGCTQKAESKELRGNGG